MRTIISCGLYTFYPIFHCSLYYTQFMYYLNKEILQFFSLKIRGLKSRAGYNGVCTVPIRIQNLDKFLSGLQLHSRRAVLHRSSLGPRVFDMQMRRTLATSRKPQTREIEYKRPPQLQIFDPFEKIHCLCVIVSNLPQVRLNLDLNDFKTYFSKVNSSKMYRKIDRKVQFVSTLRSFFV